MKIERALIFIFLSVMMVSGPAFLGLLYYKSQKQQRSTDERYHIRSIVHSGKLPTGYLAELLNLSIDQPTNLFAITSKNIEKLLLTSPLIKEAHVKKILPDKLYISYSLRKPLAIVHDFENTLVDNQGHLFPNNPFNEVTDLPQIYLGLTSYESPIQEPQFKVAKELLNKDTQFIDVSKIYAPSYGQREIIILTHDTTLRLGTDDYKKQLQYYNKFQNHFHASLIDLRIPNIGIIKP